MGRLFTNYEMHHIALKKNIITYVYVSHVRPKFGQDKCIWNQGFFEDELRLKRLQRKGTREIYGFLGFHYLSRL